MDERKVPLSARGAQIVPASATGSDGGKDRLPALAALANELGFVVRAVLDHDKPGTDNELINGLQKQCQLVVHLPERVAVERALVLGVPPDALRAALLVLNEYFELGLRVEEVDDAGLEKRASWALKQKGGLHKAWVALLPKGAIPPIAKQVLEALKQQKPDCSLVELTAP
jgi:putative ATP-dependent endonuclease of OLD family